MREGWKERDTETYEKKGSRREKRSKRRERGEDVCRVSRRRGGRERRREKETYRESRGRWEGAETDKRQREGTNVWKRLCNRLYLAGREIEPVMSG